MFKFQKVGRDSRPAVWRTILLALISAFGGLICIVFSPAGFRAGTPAGTDIDAAVVIVALILDIALATALVWRHRIPFGLTIAAALGAVILPIGTVPALIALAALLGRRRGPATWWCTALVAVTTVIDVIVDGRAQPIGASVTASIFQANNSLEARNTTSILTALLGAATFLIIGIGAGLIRRSRREVIVTGRDLSAAHQRVARLDDEVSRRQEREKIAQEVHDSLGHSLSLISLQAASLETKLDGTDHVESAKTLRESAGKAMSELRSLLSEPMTPAPDLPLSKLAEVVEDTFGAGQPITASIYVSEGDSADPALSRAVYVDSLASVNGSSCSTAPCVELRKTGCFQSPLRSRGATLLDPATPDVGVPAIPCIEWLPFSSPMTIRWHAVLCRQSSAMTTPSRSWGKRETAGTPSAWHVNYDQMSSSWICVCPEWTA